MWRLLCKHTLDFEVVTLFLFSILPCFKGESLESYLPYDDTHIRLNITYNHKNNLFPYARYVTNISLVKMVNCTPNCT